MSKVQKKIQLELAFMKEIRGEAPDAPAKGAELPMANQSLSDFRYWRLDEHRTKPNRRIRTRMYGGVAGKAREGFPMPIIRITKGHPSLEVLLFARQRIMELASSG